MPLSHYAYDGPVGGSGGDEVPPWSMPLDGTIGRIEIKWGDYINQLLFHFASPTYGAGVISLGGYDSGSYYVDIPLEAGDMITALAGKCGSYIDSLTITTSKAAGGTHQYGPFGGSGGQRFKAFTVPTNGRFIGLFGRAGLWTDALGVVYSVVDPIET